ncbi:hypothetical protein [Allokutzneria albata]|uniref:Amidase domain-containing protein n=1 Tax=Allokutzneria albata TaxID=211114 RepID=A0A1G9VRT3_ALLAB|nr:hypothetical protein [Allokutzneria albata]SDM74874.1 hypothetical protein SAMN04489726_3197 [Allokutzneria albata]
MPRKSVVMLALAMGLSVGAVAPAAAEPAPAESPAQVSETDAGIQATTRAAAIARARTWLTANGGKPIPYSMSKYFQGWRTDCSGYASMVWNVRTASGSPVNHNTDSMLRGGYGTPGAVVKAISWDQIRQGDAIGKLGAGSLGSAGHVMIFDKWADAAKTTYWVYEQASSSRGTAHRTHSRSYNGYKPYAFTKFSD